ncbi:MAG: sulfur oxidation c-type cytochrome SoxA [Minwuia sp.]|uniref:sulfur oxidation c-type cytochrome SoxA n=1 Tax=Minwuia sp. TaxID=2493630 RepID=UPI003A8B3D88
MKKILSAGAIAVLAAFSLPALAEMDTDKLEGVKPVSADHPLPKIISGYQFRNAETQALQDDDFDNPGFIWVDQAEQLWSQVDGAANKSCAECHGDAADSMKGVRATYPKWNDAKGKPVTLEQQINACRTERMEAQEWTWESDEMLGMTAYVGAQSRGMPMNVKTDGEAAPWFERGKELYYTRFGQLDMACSNCHEDNYGKYIRADMLSQGHTNGFPVYRLKWQKLGSIHRRFKGCMGSIRADGFAVGSDELIALELYVAWRGQGLPVEAPSVRQ